MLYIVISDVSSIICDGYVGDIIAIFFISSATTVSCLTVSSAICSTAGFNIAIFLNTALKSSTSFLMPCVNSRASAVVISVQSDIAANPSSVKLPSIIPAAANLDAINLIA